LNCSRTGRLSLIPSAGPTITLFALRSGSSPVVAGKCGTAKAPQPPRRGEWCFLRASYLASRGVMKRAVPREFAGCSVPVHCAFPNGLRMPLGKEKVDTRKWKVDFLDQRVLVESTIYFLPSTFYPLLSTLCEARPCWLGAWRNAALYFSSRCPNRVVFRVARVAKTLGF